MVIVSAILYYNAIFYLFQMYNWGWWLLCLVAVWGGWWGEGSAAPDAMARPVRPKSFASPDDLRTYLDQLGQYYAVAGRPR